MAETNPLFEISADALFTLRTVHGPLRDPRTFQKPSFVTELTSGSNTAITATDKPETLVLDLAYTYPATKAFFKAVYRSEPQVAHLAIDDIAPWRPANYVARRLTTSQATAFSNIDALRSSSGPDLIKHLSRYLRSLFQQQYGPQLSERIETLSNMVREESDGTLALSGESLENLIAFLEQNAKLVRPNVVAGPSGEIIAIWRGGKSGEFTARFMPNGTVYYLVSKPNPRHPKGVSRQSGDTTPDKLFDDARLSDFQWMSRR